MKGRDPRIERWQREKNRMSDLMVTRGLLALLVREVARLSKADPAMLAEWQAFAAANINAGGLMGEPIPREDEQAAIDRAIEAISEILDQGLLGEGA